MSHASRPSEGSRLIADQVRGRPCLWRGSYEAAFAIRACWFGTTAW